MLELKYNMVSGRVDQQGHIIYGVQFALKPLFTAMTACGIVNWNDSKLVNKKALFLKAYCIFVTFLSAANVFRYFFSYAIFFQLDIDEMTVMVIIHIWMMQVALCLPAGIYGVSAHMTGLLQSWDEYRVEYGGTDITDMRKFTLKLVVSMNFLLFLALIVTSGLALTHAYFNMLASIILGPFYQPGDVVPAYVLVPYFIIHFLLLYVPLQLFLLQIIPCILVKREFLHLTSSFTSEITKKRQSNVRHFDIVEKYRMCHHSLCRVTKLLDDMLSLQNLFTYITNLPILCFELFSLISMTRINRNVILDILCSAISIFVAISHVLTVTMVAANLMTAVSITLVRFTSNLPLLSK